MMGLSGALRYLIRMSAGRGLSIFSNIFMDEEPEGNVTKTKRKYSAESVTEYYGCSRTANLLDFFFLPDVSIMFVYSLY